VAHCSYQQGTLLNAMPIYLQQLVDELPQDIEGRVKAALKEHRDKIREALILHTRMTLRHYNDDLFGGGQFETINIGVAVRPGLPEPLQPRDNLLFFSDHIGNISLAYGTTARSLR